MSDPSSNGTQIVNGNPYAPQEPPQAIFLEKADFVGMHLSDMLYGKCRLAELCNL